MNRGGERGQGGGREENRIPEGLEPITQLNGELRDSTKKPTGEGKNPQKSLL